MKETKLYNMVFPTFTLFLIMPSLWLIALPVNFIFDSLVIFIIFAVFYKRPRFDLYKKVILPIWLFGFLADVPGAIYLSTVGHIIHAQYYESPRNLGENILSGIYMVTNHSSVEDLWSFLYMMSGILISAILIFLLNLLVFHLKLKGIILSKKQKLLA